MNILITILTTTFFMVLAVGAVILNYKRTNYKRSKRDDREFTD